jgi:hypothetical protein
VTRHAFRQSHSTVLTVQDNLLHGFERTSVNISYHIILMPDRSIGGVTTTMDDDDTKSD